MSEHDPRHGALLRRWGAVVARRAAGRRVVWAVLVVAGFGIALGAFGTPSLFDRLDSGEIVVDGENSAGRDLLATGGGSGFSTYTQTLTGVDLTDPAVATAAATAVKDLTAIEHVESAVNPFVVPEGPTSPSALRFTLDGDPASGGFATVVTFDADNTAEQEATATEQVDVVLDRLAEQTGATGDQRGGLRSLVDRIIAQVKTDGQRGEGIALPVSFAVMVVVFGGFVAAGFPVLGAVASIAGALVSLLGFSYLLDLDATAVNVVTVLALGLCIDYGLLMVSRCREELRAMLRGAPVTELTHEQVVEATATTMHRAGRTVVFSALTVAISLGGPDGARDPVHPGDQRGRGLGGARRARRRAHPHPRPVRPRRPPAATPWHRERRRHRRLLAPRRASCTGCRGSSSPWSPGCSSCSPRRRCGWS